MKLCTETVCSSLCRKKCLNVTVGFSKTVQPATLLVELRWWPSHLYKYLATTFSWSSTVRFFFFGGVTWRKEPIKIIPARWMASRRQFRRQRMVSPLQCWDAWNISNRVELCLQGGGGHLQHLLWTPSMYHMCVDVCLYVIFIYITIDCFM